MSTVSTATIIKFKNILDELFTTMKKLVRTNTSLCNSLTEDYKQGLLMYLKMIPDDDALTLINGYNIIKIYLTCIDFNKALDMTRDMMTHKNGLMIDSKELVKNMINKIDQPKDKKHFLQALLKRLDILFNCIDYILSHPHEVLTNADVFKTLVEDENVFC